MASLIKRKQNSQHVPPCCKGIYIRWHLIFFYLCTWFSCIKKIGQSCICWTVRPALQSSSSNCLVLIPHRQLGNFCPHISPPSSQIKKFQIKGGHFFQDEHFEYPYPLCYLEKYSFCLISPLQVVRMKKFQDKSVVISFR